MKMINYIKTIKENNFCGVVITAFNSECASLDKNAGSLILSLTIFC